MSISTLTEDKVDRNAQRAAAAATPQAGAPAGGGAPTSQAGPGAATDQAGVAPAPQVDTKKTISDAISAVGAYVPTEIIAAYTIVLALDSDDDRHHGIPFSWFFAMFVFTPIFVWLVYAVRSKESNRDFLSPRLWPWWEAIAACLAFTVWSAALPDSAFARFDWYSSKLAAVALMIVSGLLPLIGSLVTSPRKPA